MLPPGRLVGAALLLLSMAVAAGDAVRGGELYDARCGACHSVDADRVGPRHAGVVGRRAGAVATYDYSPALKASTIVWDATTLGRWLADPEGLIPGQRMGYRVDDARDRADLIEFLTTLR
jgi:cytochrome c